MGSAENKEVVRRLVKDIWNQGDATAIDRHFAATFRNHNPNLPLVTDRGSFAEWVAAMRYSFPDGVTHIDGLVAEGDFVVARWTMRGTHRGTINGMPPTGRMVTVTGTTFYHLLAGQVIECWWIIDTIGLLKQIGALQGTVMA
ncbi:MAG: ester cyclase [Chloroflexales bacterium]|nr:ester cyclase [Chloroflexales bacterium]